MSRSRLCKVCSQWHDVAEPWPQACSRGPAPERAPSIRPDGMDAIRSQADGQVYDSKSAYYGSVKRAGCEIVGDDRNGFGSRPEYRPQGVGQEIKRSIEMLRSRG